MVVKPRKTSSKNPPILSHEFVIQNHADIVSCVAMVFVVGLMFQTTQPLASIFIAMHHNATPVEELTYGQEMTYTTGLKDLCAVFFYTLIGVVVHAVIQEYILDKIKTKLHLSKVKQSKFNESGQLLLFYVVAVLWGGDVIFREGLLFNVSALWRDYPNIAMTFMFKFFFIVQMAYWLHCYPELYFQKVKREDMPARITYATIYLVTIAAAYAMNFTRLALCLLVLHYAAETVFHVARLIHFADKPSIAAKAFSVWNTLFVVTRLASIILSVSTFWFGLADNESVSFVVRVSGLAAVVSLQVYMLQRFLTFHLSRRREASRLTATAEAEAKKAKQDKKAKKAREAASKKSTEEKEISELPEVDQNTSKSLRQRGAAKSK
ncbi:translocating chain-associated membrane protein 1 [Daphnia magna]|uniref:Translocating chain-associated membrane protein n=2 Tax=Daphnia magna TaxID=35525 RepID=A0A0P6GCW7_9CRUS|nr:translocating chain-associated membrane protein 1 [Daphnia magna]KAK4004409.1 hypothetical protein OUZ56_006142 [Daphnia magna]KZS16088.1 Translocating chain-associated membrane protein [Daphnia magna]